MFYLPIYNFAFHIRDNNIGTGLFDIPLHMSQYFINVLAAIADTTDTQYGYLPAILLINLGNRHLKLMTHPRHHRFNDLPLILQRVALRQVQRDLTDSNYHAASIT